MKGTKISYVHHTFNPWWGCVEVSSGCDHCYARMLARRLGKGYLWGAEADRMEMSGPYWRDPLRWNDAAARAGVRERVLCGSMCDVMEQPRDGQRILWWRQRLYDLIQETPNLDWLLITKRPENFRVALPEAWRRAPRPNVWLIATVESPEYIWRIEELGKVPAVVHGVSIEPMLGRMDLWVPRNGVDWLILGGETGFPCVGERAFDLNAARAIIRHSQNQGIAIYVKQLGSAWAKANGARAWSGDDPAEWPKDLRVREFPEVRA